MWVTLCFSAVSVCIQDQTEAQVIKVCFKSQSRDTNELPSEKDQWSKNFARYRVLLTTVKSSNQELYDL